jgi:hypothetical protein
VTVWSATKFFEYGLWQDNANMLNFPGAKVVRVKSDFACRLDERAEDDLSQPKAALYAEASQYDTDPSVRLRASAISDKTRTVPKDVPVQCEKVIAIDYRLRVKFHENRRTEKAVLN